jgi:hypothetical protein
MEYTMAAFMFDLNCTPPLLDLNCTPPVSCTPPTGGYAPDQDAGFPLVIATFVLQFLSKAPKKFKQNQVLQLFAICYLLVFFSYYWSSNKVIGIYAHCYLLSVHFLTAH